MGLRTPTISNLKPGHQATLFPSLVYFDAKRNRFRAQVHGRVFDDGRTPIGSRILLRGLKRAMQVTPEDVASETFQRRIDGFLAAPAKRKRIVLQIGSQRFRLIRRTRSNGAFYGTLTIPDEAIRDVASSQQLSMSLLRSGVTHAEDHSSSDEFDGQQPTAGTLHFVPPTGISVVSDIDDTIKLTNATNKREMLNNTFLRPFEEVAGMSELYRQWQATGCDFHYVSSSPWQLYEPLAELCSASQFPPGSMHLRYFRVRDEMLKRVRPVRRHSKVGVILGILKRLPNRKFLLVGDSGEKDPEIYRLVAQRFPERIAAILIRDLDARPLDSKRLQQLNSVTGTTDVRIFRTTAEIDDVVSNLKLIL